MCMLELYGTYLLTSDLQFGFKKGLGCSHALFAAISVVDYFTNHGSTMNLCALDMSKAFVKVNHYALFNKLMDRSIPREFLSILISWCSISAAYVRWDNMLSDLIVLACGGGVLSPILFAVYVNDVIEKSSNSNSNNRTFI